jgi:N-acetylmuramoyl-L-alanine amidase
MPPHHSLPSVPPGLRAGRCRRVVLPAMLVAAGLLLAGCATPPGGLVVDHRYRAQGQDSRAQFLVLHYTGAPFDVSLRTLTQGDVSAHYLISDETPPVIYQLVDEVRRAWHAGQSQWQGASLLNASSIGIEVVNRGPQTAADGTVSYPPYPPAQTALLLRLVRDIVARHGIRPEHVLGHSDIAPQRKIDPGPVFPWPALAAAGLVAWPEPSRVAAHRLRYEAALPEAIWFQRTLAAIGYAVPDNGLLDGPTRRVIAAFQMKYRPARFDGQPDAETAALMQVLSEPLPRAVPP